MDSITNNTDITNIVISGVGGQGVLTLAEILAKAALAESLNVRVGEIHGMAQRGGHVVCTVRIGDGVKGPIIDEGDAQLVVGFEPIETLREVQFIRTNGMIIMNSHVQYPVAVSMGKAEYPEHSEILEGLKKFTSNIVEFDARKFAMQAGSSRSMNIVMLGAIIGSGLVPIKKDTAIEVVRNAFPGKFADANIKAFELGYEAAKAN
ncbi:MAG: indolepyruvate ferredoxin oxidoreductase subunit beta [Candidatus Thorarchaeota archaeon]